MLDWKLILIRSLHIVELSWWLRGLLSHSVASKKGTLVLIPIWLMNQLLKHTQTQSDKFFRLGGSSLLGTVLACLDIREWRVLLTIFSCHKSLVFQIVL